MKTYKGMLSVVCCWCLCLSLCSFSLAENATTDKPVVEKPAITQKITSDQKIALLKQNEKAIYEAKLLNSEPRSIGKASTERPALENNVGQKYIMENE